MKGIVKSYKAGGAVGQYRIVKFGADDKTIVQAAATGDGQIGICCQPGGSTIGQRVDVTRTGIEDVEYGGNVTRGDLLTSDANGKAVAVTRHTHVESGGTTAAASNVRVIGTAELSGAAGDIGQVLLAPGAA
ncbi:DUF2190 domain-containing protein [Niveispirillum sp. KHB5.9]|uniref:DUF2190 domain-containing protein n=1 Tax=Niveispirillum sp. KHB5.9 TaxID=3400269 RepID=UPI003A8A98A5